MFGLFQRRNTASAPAKKDGVRARHAMKKNSTGIIDSNGYVNADSFPHKGWTSS